MLPNLGALSLGAPTGVDDFSNETAARRRREAAERQALREQLLAAAEARAAARADAAAAAAAAADSSDDERYDEPPIHTLQRGPFDLIVKMLLERLTPDAEAINGSDADAMCRDVAKVCRELATLDQLPGLADDEVVVDPKYDCSDPNAKIWRKAHAIFGVDPMKNVKLRQEGQSWKENFRNLCQVFNPQQGYYYFTEGHSEPRWYDASLWATLKMVYEEGEVDHIPEYRDGQKPETAAFVREVRKPLGTGTEVITWRLRHLPLICYELDTTVEKLMDSYEQTKRDIAEFFAYAKSDDNDDDGTTDTHGTVTTWHDYEYPDFDEQYYADIRCFASLRRLLKTLQRQAQAEADRLQMAPVTPDRGRYHWLRFSD